MIKNTPKKYLDDPVTQGLRSAFEHRGTWFYLLIDEMVKNGLDMDTARAAIFKCGCIHGSTKYPKTDSLLEFYKAFMPENIQKILEVKSKVSEDALEMEFGYCPLVASWQKLTDDEEKIKHLCDIAMDGDRGVISQYGNFELELGDRIVYGCPTCQLRIKKKK